MDSLQAQLTECLFHAEDEDTGRRRLDLDRRVADAVGIERHIHVAGHQGSVRLFVTNAHSPEELSAGLGDAEEQQGGGSGNRKVDAVLDRGEDGDDDSDEEDEGFEGRREPVRVGLPRGGDETADGLD